jgi:hypothetical protein
MDPKMIGRKERILVVEELWRDNERLRSLLADVIRYWELRDPNRGAALETVIKRRVKNALRTPSPFGGPGWTPKEPK